MPPPGSFKKDFASPVELDQPIDPNEPTFCVCHQCQGGEWFHYACVGLTPETDLKESGFAQPADNYHTDACAAPK